MTIKERLDLVFTEIESTLKLPYYYLKRDKKVTSCLTYQYTDFPNGYSDGVETSTRYDIYINLILDAKLTATTEKVATILKKHGFKKVVINSPRELDLNSSNVHEITMNFKIILESEVD